MRRIAFLVLSLALVATAAPPSNTFHVGGAVAKPADFTADQVQQQLAADVKEIKYPAKEPQHTYHCVPLLSLLKAAGLPTNLKMGPTVDPKTKNYPLRFVVCVQGNDGYTAAFSLGELLPNIGNKQVWIALDSDGNPLSERDAPARLIVPEDSMPARSVHAIATITVIDTTSATTQPSN